MSEDMNTLSWSMIIDSGMQYFVIMFSISASPISSDLAWCMGIVNQIVGYLISNTQNELMPFMQSRHDFQIHAESL